MSDTIMMFIKIGALEHITDLYENGTVYLNSLEYFKKIEDGFLRGDQNEGALSLVNAKNVSAKFSFMNEEDKPINLLNLSYGTYLDLGNLYSLYCISSHGFPNPRDFKFDRRNLEFGSHCLVITKPGEFIDRMKVELNKLNQRFDYGFVKYYEEKVQLEDLGPFDKLDVFEYQKEFRFFVENAVNEPIKINIGSMKSYAEIFETKDLLSIELQQGNKKVSP